VNSGDAYHDEGALRGVPSAGAAPSTSPEALSGEREYENVLRPQRFCDFVGQTRVTENLGLAIQGARTRGEALDHVLLSGPPGLGKTSLARVLASELGVSLTVTSGPALERPRDLVGTLTQLQARQVLFVDEIHRVPIAVEEYLYSAMEDLTVDVMLDQGPHARSMTLNIEPFTLIGATTRDGLLSAPFRARFGIVERLDPYPPAELEEIVLRSARILAVDLELPAARVLAQRSRGTPRVANRLLRRLRDEPAVLAGGSADARAAEVALARQGIDELGLEEMDRRILRVLVRDPERAIGLKTIAAAVSESEDTIEEVYEPHLLRQGLIEKTARGRCITERGQAALATTPMAGGAEPDRST